MSKAYTYIPDLTREIVVPEDGILSRTLQNDEKTKIIGFGFAAGQELSAHTAPMPAVLCFLQGEAELKLGEDVMDAKQGTVVHMPPRLEHGIRAKTAVVMLLVLVKQS